MAEPYLDNNQVSALSVVTFFLLVLLIFNKVIILLVISRGIYFLEIGYFG